MLISWQRHCRDCQAALYFSNRPQWGSHKQLQTSLHGAHIKVLLRQADWVAGGSGFPELAEAIYGRCTCLRAAEAARKQGERAAVKTPG